MKQQRALWISIFAVLLVVAPATCEPVFDSTGASFATELSAGVLTVTGPGGVRIVREFSSGATPTFSVYDDAGQLLPDGTYEWEIRPATTGGERAGRRASHEDLSGTFAITGGVIGEATSASTTAVLHVRSDTNPLAQFQNTAGTARVTLINGNSTEWRLANSGLDTFRIAEQTDSTTELELDADGTLRLKEQNTAPASCTDGSLYADDSGALCFCESGSWVVAAGSGSCS